MAPVLAALALAVQRHDLGPLDGLAHKAFQYFVDNSNPETGFTLDRARNPGAIPEGAPPASEDNKTVASIATTGFALAAYALGSERGWISRNDAVRRARLTLKACEKVAPREHGWFMHWLDWRTGERKWNSEVSTIDTGIFLCGMVLAERGLKDKEVSERAGRILKGVDWNWALTDDGAKPKELFFCHGWRPEEGFLKWRWASWCELPLLYVLAYGCYDQMPKDSWDKIERPLVQYNGRSFFVGGPLFLHQMSQVFIDFRGRRDRGGYDYWVEARNAALANRDYCVLNPKGFQGYSRDVWGLSASDGPDGYRGYGAPGWVTDDGTIAPSSAVACAFLAPSEAKEVANGVMLHHPETVGKYGFTIAFNPTKGWQSPDVIGIDLGQMLLAIENYRDDLPHRLFMSHPLAVRAMRRMGFRRTAELDATERPLRIPQ